MIEALLDGTYRVPMWTHPRTLKIHVREDCKAMRRLIVERDPVVVDFPSRDAIREWFENEANCEPEMVCRWCFPQAPTTDPELPEAQHEAA